MMDTTAGGGRTVNDRDFNAQMTVSRATFVAAMESYRNDSESAVAGLPGYPGIPFDSKSGERLDVWGTGPEPRPVFVYIHGGYWRALSRHDSGFMSRTLAQEGIATVVPDYSLAPTATLEEIVRQMRAVIDWIHKFGPDHGLDPNRIVVGGSSAGGHLAAMLLLDGWQTRLHLPKNAIAGALLVSGLFDLRPLVESFVNEWLNLELERAAALSPALQLPAHRPPITVAVAEHDAAGFLRQSANFHRDWAGSPSSEETEHLVIPDRHHFDVIIDLAIPGTALNSALLGLFNKI